MQQKRRLKEPDEICMSPRKRLKGAELSCGWDLLPVEIEVMIFEYANIMKANELQPDDATAVTQVMCRCVCRHWRDIIPRSTKPIQVGLKAAKLGLLSVLKWAREQNSRWDHRTFQFAAEAGQVEILKWLIENGWTWTSVASRKAAENGQLEVLKWARANGYFFHSYVVCDAASGGHLEILKWLLASGCPWEKEVFYYAANIEVLEWLRAKEALWIEANGDYIRAKKKWKWVQETGGSKS